MIGLYSNDSLLLAAKIVKKKELISDSLLSLIIGKLFFMWLWRREVSLYSLSRVSRDGSQLRDYSRILISNLNYLECTRHRLVWIIMTNKFKWITYNERPFKLIEAARKGSKGLMIRFKRHSTQTTQQAAPLLLIQIN